MIPLISITQDSDGFSVSCVLIQPTRCTNKKKGVDQTHKGLKYENYGERSSVVKASELKSEDPRFDPLAGQGEEQFVCPSESTLVQTCLCLTPLRVYGTHPHLYAC